MFLRYHSVLHWVSKQIYLKFRPYLDPKLLDSQIIFRERNFETSQQVTTKACKKYAACIKLACTVKTHV